MKINLFYVSVICVFVMSLIAACKKSNTHPNYTAQLSKVRHYTGHVYDGSKSYDFVDTFALKVIDDKTVIVQVIGDEDARYDSINSTNEVYYFVTRVYPTQGTRISYYPFMDSVCMEGSRMGIHGDYHKYWYSRDNHFFKIM